MLDEKTIQIVQSTVPLLKENSEAIGKTFYKLLFSKAPDLYNLFNQTNQKRGIQQEALAYAVYAAGEHITNLEAIMPVVTRVTEKHRAIGVVAEQYPVVGETLLQAVKDVLGDGATDEVIDAWGKTYNYIADVFIEIEKKLYTETENQPGGWDGFRRFIIDKKEEESSEVVSFYLKPEDGNEMPTFHAGQYLTLQADIPGEKYTHMRHYSLSDAPGNDYYRISVKREDEKADAPAGIVSSFLHADKKPGDTLEFSAPAGDFVLDNKALPIVLISGGIGITPLLSMLNTVVEVQPERNVIFIHATANSKTHAFREHIGQLAKNHLNVTSLVLYDQPNESNQNSQQFDKAGFIDLDFIQSNTPSKDAIFYFCGPLPFTEAVNRILQESGVSEENMHFEVFNPISILGEQ